MNPLLRLPLLLVFAASAAAQTNVIAPGETILLGPNGAMRIQVQNGTLQVGGRVFTTQGQPTPPAGNAPLRVTWDTPRPFVPVGEPVILNLRVSGAESEPLLPDGLALPDGLSARLLHQGRITFENAGVLSSGKVFAYQITGGSGYYQLTNVTVDVAGRSVPAPPVAFAFTQATDVPANAKPEVESAFPDTGPAYVGQTVMLRVRVIDPGDGRVRAVPRVTVNGPGIIVGDTPDDRGTEVVLRNGKPALAFVVDVPVTFALPGTHALSAAAQAYSLTQADLNQGAAFQPTTFPAPPLVVEVRRLPRPEAAGFSGGVGRFTCDPPALSTNALAAGTPLQLTVTLRGENATRVTPPPAPKDPRWQVIPQPLPAAGPGPSRDDVTQFTFVLVPRTAEATHTPAIPFSVFDPGTTAYVDLTVPPVAVTVTGNTTALREFLAPPPAPDTSAATTERHLSAPSSQPGLALSSLQPATLRPGFLAAQALPALILGGLVLRERRRRFLLAHPELVRLRRARAGLRRELRHLRRAARRREADAWTRAAVHALREACAPFAGGHPDALVLADVLPHLAEGQDLARTVFEAHDRSAFAGDKPVPDASLLASHPRMEALLRTLRDRL